MAEYIEREKAIECVKPHVKPTTVYGEGYMQAIEHAVDILELMPAEDVQPIHRGHWIEKVSYSGWGVSIYTCSECENAETIPSKFCPNCGAELRGVENG